MDKSNISKGTEHLASARSLNLPVSTKHSIEIAKAIRYKTTSYAKKYLEEVVDLKRAVEFRTFKRNVGHKAGIASGRFPQKAARQFIKLVQAVEANAQFKGLNVEDLKIVKMVANLASIPSGGGRRRHKTKRTHLEIVVKERTPLSKKNKEAAKAKNTELKAEQKTENSTPEDATNIKPTVKPVPPSARSGSLPSTLAQPISEPTSQELLKKAQARAAQLNKRETEKKSVDEVSQLYSKLSQKGTLREGGK